MHRLFNINLLRVLLILIATVFTSSGASAQETAPSSYSLTLKEAIALALENQVNVLNAELDETIAQKQVKEITGIGLPQITGSIDFNDYVKLPTQLLPGEFFGQPAGTFIPIQFGTQYNATAGLSASQLIFDGTYLVGLKAAKTFKELSQKRTKLTKQEAAANVTKAYYAVQVAQNNLNTLIANLDRLSKTYNEMQVMYDNGLVEKIDVDRLKVNLNNLQIEKKNIENAIGITKNLLKFQIGILVGAEITLKDTISTNAAAPPASLEANVESRIDYSLLQTQRELNLLDIRRHRSGYLPSIGAFGSLSYQAMRNEFNFFDFDQDWFSIAVIGAQLRLPIFDGLQKAARIEQAKLSLAKTENNLLMLENAINMDIQIALTQYRNSYQTLEAMKENLDLAEEIVRVSQIKYEEGVGSGLEVTEAETSLRESRTNYYSALFNLLVSQVDLQKAQGTLLYE